MSPPDTSAFKGMQVWIRRDPEDDQVYDKGVVSSVSQDAVKVKVGPKEKSIKQSQLLLDDSDSVDALLVSDITQLSNSNEAAISDVVRRRFEQNIIYTFARPLLMVVNPFKDLGVTGPADIARFKNLDGEAEPHIFGLARQGLEVYAASGQKNVSFVISGESGAGKTETTKHLMQYFAASGPDSDEGVQRAVLAGNPILEGFGNAKTARNNNSSRFGRFMALYLQPGGGIEAGEVSSYLLEKSRISNPGPGERNFHIFYQMLRGLDAETKTKLRLRDVRDFRFLAVSGCFDVENKDDAADFTETKDAFKLIGLSEGQVQAVLKILAAVLHCGQLDFTRVQDDDKALASPSDRGLFDFLANDLLGLSPDALLKQLTVQTRRLPGGQTVESPVTAVQAKANLESLGRSAYAKLFEWLISVLNATIRPSAAAASKGWVGVLDLFGFEIFAENSLEQFLINFANEKLQQFFTEHVFQEEKKLYEREGIDASDVVYEDNKDLLAVFENPVTKSGILEHLESVSLLQTGTVEAFFSTLNKQNYDAKFFALPKAKAGSVRFLINHTAAPVLYDASLFRDKNMDRLNVDLVSLVVASSTNLVLKDSFGSAVPGGAGGAAAGGSNKYTCGQFKESMQSLLAILRHSHPFFVRCVKPNQAKRPGLYTTKDVINQLHSLSIMEAINLARKGFSYRRVFAEFLTEFRLLRHLPGLSNAFALEEQKSKEGALGVLKAVVKRGEGMSYQDARFGESMVFLKKTGHLALDTLKRRTQEEMKEIARSVKKHLASAAMHAEFAYEVEGLVRIQSQMRCYFERKALVRTEQVKRLLLGSLGLMKKAHEFLYDRKNGLVLQTAFRNFAAMRRYEGRVKAVQSKEASETIIQYSKTIAAMNRLDAHREEVRLIRGCVQVQRATRNFLTKQAFRRNWIWRMLVWPARVKFIARDKAATTIQALWRGFEFRKTFPDRANLEISMRSARYRVVLQREIIPLQVALKSYVATRRFQLLKATVDAVEMRLLTKVIRDEFLRVKMATRKIQRFYRGWTIRQLVALHKAAVVFQAERARLAFEHRRVVAPVIAKRNAEILESVVANDKKKSVILRLSFHKRLPVDAAVILGEVLSGKFGDLVQAVKQTKQKIYFLFSDTQKIVRVDLVKLGLVEVCVNPEIAQVGSKISAFETTQRNLYVLVSSGRVYCWKNEKFTLDPVELPKRATIATLAARHRTLALVDVDGRAHAMVEGVGQVRTVANLPGHAMRAFVTDEEVVVVLKNGSLFSLRTRSEIFHGIFSAKMRVSAFLQGENFQVILNGTSLYIWGRRRDILFPAGYKVGVKHGIFLTGEISRPIRVCPSNMQKGGWLVEEVEISGQSIFVRTHSGELFVWSGESLYFDSASNEALLDPHLTQSLVISRVVGNLCCSDSGNLSLSLATVDKSVSEILRHRAAAFKRAALVTLDKKFPTLSSRKPVIVSPVKKRFTASVEKSEITKRTISDSLITYRYRYRKT